MGRSVIATSAVLTACALATPTRAQEHAAEGSFRLGLSTSLVSIDALDVSDATEQPSGDPAPELAQLVDDGAKRQIGFGSSLGLDLGYAALEMHHFGVRAALEFSDFLQESDPGTVRVRVLPYYRALFEAGDRGRFFVSPRIGFEHRSRPMGPRSNPFRVQETSFVAGVSVGAAMFLGNKVSLEPELVVLGRTGSVEADFSEDFETTSFEGNTTGYTVAFLLGVAYWSHGRELADDDRAAVGSGVDADVARQDPDGQAMPAPELTAAFSSERFQFRLFGWPLRQPEHGHLRIRLVSRERQLGDCETVGVTADGTTYELPVVERAEQRMSSAVMESVFTHMPWGLLDALRNVSATTFDICGQSTQLGPKATGALREYARRFHVLRGPDTRGRKNTTTREAREAVEEREAVDGSHTPEDATTPSSKATPADPEDDAPSDDEEAASDERPTPGQRTQQGASSTGKPATSETTADEASERGPAVEEPAR